MAGRVGLMGRCVAKTEVDQARRARPAKARQPTLCRIDLKARRKRKYCDSCKGDQALNDQGDLVRLRRSRNRTLAAQAVDISQKPRRGLIHSKSDHSIGDD